MDDLDRQVDERIREAVRQIDPNIQYVADGYLIIETMDADETSPTLRYHRIGDPTPWALAGMLTAAQRAVNRDLDDGFNLADE